MFASSQSSRPEALRALVGVACATACGVMLAGTWPSADDEAQTAQPRTASVCNITTNERIVAVGDIHGAYDGFVSILRAAGILDTRDRWIAGRAQLVQTGDVLDRGPDSRRALDLLRRLERDASRAGGRVHALLGNHEVMRVIGDWRYVSPAELAAFRNAGSEELRERVLAAVAENARQQTSGAGTPFDEAAFRASFLREFPFGSLEMVREFDPKGEYGSWLSARDTMIKINGIVFIHGGVDAAAAAMGCEEINAAVRRDVAGGKVLPEQGAALFASSETGPLWYRGLAVEPEEAFGPTLAAILSKLEARAIVVGHTVSPGRIVTRFGGRVVQIDTGMLDGEFFPGGGPSALEIRGGSATAIYTNRREPIQIPREPIQIPAR